MKFKLNKHQIKMLIDGKELRNGKEKIVATDNIRQSLQKINPDQVNVYIVSEGEFYKKYSITIEPINWNLKE